jgi:hypothetical protein
MQELLFAHFSRAAGILSLKKSAANLMHFNGFIATPLSRKCSAVMITSADLNCHSKCC